MLLSLQVPADFMFVAFELARLIRLYEVRGEGRAPEIPDPKLARINQQTRKHAFGHLTQ